jgi:hypothetical protein
MMLTALAVVAPQWRRNPLTWVSPWWALRLRRRLQAISGRHRNRHIQHAQASIGAPPRPLVDYLTHDGNSRAWAHGQ